MGTIITSTAPRSRTTTDNSNSSHGAAHAHSGGDGGSGNPTTPGSLFDTFADFQFEGQMGPVATCRHARRRWRLAPSEDNFGMLTMDSILSSAFWDNVLVPGESFHHVCEVGPVLTKGCLQGTRTRWKASAAGSCTARTGAA